MAACRELLVAACGIWVPDQRLNPGPLHCKRGVLATGPPGRPLVRLLLDAERFGSFCGWPVSGWQSGGSPRGEGYADSPSSPLCLPVAGDCLSEKETEDLMAWMRNALGSRITDVKVRLCNGPPASRRDPP